MNIRFSTLHVVKKLLTRQRAVFKSQRGGDNRCVIATHFTCQRALRNPGKWQGDSQRFIATRFTCQRALCNRGIRQEKPLRSYEKLLALHMSNCENLSETVKALYCVKKLRICEKHVDICNTEDDVANKLKVNRTCHIKTNNL